MKRIVSKGKLLKGVVYKTPNVVVQRLNYNKRFKRCIIVGNGNSLSVDEKNRITLHDPGMKGFYLPKYIEYTTYVFYFPFECAGLKEAGKEIANFVNNLSESYEEVLLIGHSKCGICLAYAKQEILRKSFLITVSTPFAGTVTADKEACEKLLKNRLLIWVYNKIFSNHNVDKDIMPSSKIIKEIKEMEEFKPDLSITSEIDKIFECREVLDLILLFWGKRLKFKGDGIVSTVSQQACEGRINVKIRCSHATSLRKALELYFSNECLGQRR